MTLLFAKTPYFVLLRHKNFKFKTSPLDSNKKNFISSQILFYFRRVKFDLIKFYNKVRLDLNKNIKPEWDDAAKTVGGEKMIKVNVGDGTEEQKKTMNTYGIQGFPTIIMFENGSPSGPFESRDKNSFLEFFS